MEPLYSLTIELESEIRQVNGYDIVINWSRKGWTSIEGNPSAFETSEDVCRIIAPSREKCQQIGILNDLFVLKDEIGQAMVNESRCPYFPDIWIEFAD